MIKIYKGDKKLVSFKLTQFSYLKLNELSKKANMSKTAYLEKMIREEEAEKC